MLAMRFLIAFALSNAFHLSVQARPLAPFRSASTPGRLPRQILPGIFGDDDPGSMSPETLASHDLTRHATHTPSTTTVGTPSISIDLLATVTQIETELPHSSGSATSSLSIITFAFSTTPAESLAPAPTVIDSASITPPNEVEQWKVIGIGIMCVTFVGTVILLIVFFDSWWGFLCALVGRSKKDIEGIEELYSDGEEVPWKYKLAREDGHRYPTMTYSEPQAGGRCEGDEKHRNTDISGAMKSTADSPFSSYGGLNPHPLDPAFRRPSARVTHHVPIGNP
jgi:hypothetical protein